VAGEGSEEFESIELVGYLVFRGIGNDVILDGEFIESEWPSLDISSHELL
jgi:hypothetical protein